MNAYIPTKEDLEDIVSRTVKATVNEALPEAIHKATRKQWLTSDDVMDMLSCSRRHVQHLRDENLIEFHQTDRTIRYHIEDVEAYLNNGKVKSRDK
jgi:hypothetical protein